MEGTNAYSATGKNRNVTSVSTWQREIKQLHRNFFVIDTILSQSRGLSYETTKRYMALQQTIMTTMEGLLAELDQAEANKTIKGDKSTRLLRQHAIIMKQLNARVDSIVREVTA